MPNGVERITAERNRQRTKEGWTDQHDQRHDQNEILSAAICYCYNAAGNTCPEWWPWHHTWDKRNKHDDIRSLEIAGALIAAEIDRRLAQKEED